MDYNLYEYYLTQTAENDIDAVIRYISVDLSNPDAAKNFVDQLEELFEELCNTPKLGKTINNEFLRRNDVRLVHVKNYNIYYLINEMKSLVVILRIVYSGRDQDEILKMI
jgi:plasmid stabilization system protein ParE